MGAGHELLEERAYLHMLLSSENGKSRYWLSLAAIVFPWQPPYAAITIAPFIKVFWSVFDKTERWVSYDRVNAV